MLMVEFSTPAKQLARCIDDSTGAFPVPHRDAEPPDLLWVCRSQGGFPFFFPFLFPIPRFMMFTWALRWWAKAMQLARGELNATSHALSCLHTAPFQFLKMCRHYYDRFHTIIKFTTPLTTPAIQLFGALHDPTSNWMKAIGSDAAPPDLLRITKLLFPRITRITITMACGYTAAIQPAAVPFPFDGLTANRKNPSKA